jgi:thiosulfate dehydrogenase
MTRARKTLAALAALVIAAGAGLGARYVAWGWPTDWYSGHDPAKLPPSPENDLIRYGWDLVVNTASHIGVHASDPAMRYAGNDLACTNCHLNARLQPFAAPFVSTFASYPLMVNDEVETLTERIDGCMVRSMNGKPLPAGGREMEALIAYIRFVGEGSPEGVRVAGMGLLPLPPASQTPDATRGAQVYAAHCARCHGADGAGQTETSSPINYAIPPLWGPGSFNAASGMAHIETASAFIRANMPRGVSYLDPVLSVQEAWDVAAYVEAQPRPPRPAIDPGD